jgi:tetratricopeptide (TPR) repeat protein
LLSFAAPAYADIVRAREAMQRNRFAEAAEAYRAVIRTQENNMEALAGLSSALYALGRYDEIISFFPEEIRKGNVNLNQRNSEAMTILKNIGFSCYQRGQSKKAIVALSIATRIRDDDPSVYNILGLAYLNTESFRLAEINFQTAVNLAPTSPFYVNNLGAAYLEQGMYREALIAFEKSVRLDRSYQTGWGNIWLTRERLRLPSHRGEYWFSYFLTATEEEKRAHQRHLDEERRKQEAALLTQRQQQEEERRQAAEAERLRQQAAEAERRFEEERRLEAERLRQQAAEAERLAREAQEGAQDQQPPQDPGRTEEIPQTPDLPIGDPDDGGPPASGNEGE